MRILLVEDDPALGSAVRDYLTPRIVRGRLRRDAGRCAGLPARQDIRSSCSTSACPTATDSSLLPAVLRQPEPPPVLILTARDRLSDRVRGLDAGADDYLVKPFDLPELSARLRALVRRRAGRHAPQIELGAVTIDPVTREVTLTGKRVELTAQEYALIVAFAEQPRRVLSRRQLEDAIYTLDSGAVEQRRRSLRVAPAAQVRPRLDPDRSRRRLPLGRRRGCRWRGRHMTLEERRLGHAGAVARSLLVGLTLLWLTGVVGSGIVLKRLIDERSDHELQESAAMLMSLVTYTDDLLVTAALLGETRPPPTPGSPRETFAYLIRDAAGHVLLQSADAPAELLDVPLAEGLADAGGGVSSRSRRRRTGTSLQLAEPLAERREALVNALLWLTIPLAALLAFAAYIVFRASRSLVQQVQRTAFAVSRQDPQALGLLPLDGVVTEMKPAVEATNRLLGRLADALEAERSFTYNSAHELRTPIAAALAQAQVLAGRAEGTALKSRADAVRRRARCAWRASPSACWRWRAPRAAIHWPISGSISPRSSS